jgi:superfamily I DNA/RNA helicase
MNETWWLDEEQLDDDQKKIIALKLKGSHVIVGPPGSGKTNLLLLRAKYMDLAGQHNIHVVVFTRTLQEFIRLGGVEYQLPQGTVKTLTNWGRNFLYKHGVLFDPQGTFEEKRAQLITEIQGVIHAKKLNKEYEAIFLDEAQDYLPEEIAIFQHLAKVIFAAVDSRQKIYTGGDCYKLLVKDAQEHFLRYHYRIGEKICRLADAIMANSSEDSLLGKSLYNEAARPSSVEHHLCKDLDEEGEKIIEKLKIQVKAYPDEMIGVICPYNDQLDRLWELIQGSELGTLAVKQSAGDRVPFDPEKPICLCTIYSAKGLEFRALHVAGCDKLGDWPNNLNLTYTAVTRAKTSLSLYYAGRIEGYLKQALQGLEPAPDLPAIADVFSKKGKK